MKVDSLDFPRTRRSWYPSWDVLRLTRGRRNEARGRNVRSRKVFVLSIVYSFCICSASPMSDSQIKAVTVS